MDEQDFSWSTGGTLTQQAGMTHLRGVEDEEVARGDQASQIGKSAIL
jgi:hypothetical protein